MKTRIITGILKILKWIRSSETVWNQEGQIWNGKKKKRKRSELICRSSCTEKEPIPIGIKNASEYAYKLKWIKLCWCSTVMAIPLKGIGTRLKLMKISIWTKRRMNEKRNTKRSQYKRFSKQDRNAAFSCKGREQNVWSDKTDDPEPVRTKLLR